MKWWESCFCCGRLQIVIQLCTFLLWRRWTADFSHTRTSSQPLSVSSGYLWMRVCKNKTNKKNLKSLTVSLNTCCWLCFTLRQQLVVAGFCIVWSDPSMWYRGARSQPLFQTASLVTPLILLFARLYMLQTYPALRDINSSEIQNVKTVDSELRNANGSTGAGFKVHVFWYSKGVCSVCSIWKQIQSGGITLQDHAGVFF